MTEPTATGPRAGAAVGRPTVRGTKRRAAIVAAAAELFARRGYAAIGMDEIGAAAGVTGPAIYRHFDSKAAVLAAVFDSIIDAVAMPPASPSAENLSADPVAALERRIDRYAAGVAGHRQLMAVFVREVGYLPDEHAARLRQRQRSMVAEWRALLAEARPDQPEEATRTAIHAVFGMLNSVGTFTSPMPDRDLAAQLGTLARAALRLPGGASAERPKPATARDSAAARRT